MIPNTNLITSILNIRESDIKYLSTKVIDDSVFYDITLIRKPISCPFCHGNMIGHGQKTKKINHPALREHKGVIVYHANRYKCKSCGKTCLENNPFAFKGFNSSYFMQRNVMKLLGNLNYTLDMISKELSISTTQINKYLDSFITIPPMQLPENLGIDELHSPSLTRASSVYLCILVDNEHRCIYDVIDSRSKYHLSDYFSKIPREERYKVKYVTIDMWEPYKDLAETYFPKAEIAVDPFHVIKHLCDDFDDLRISLMKQCDYDSNAYYLLKKWNWLLTTDDVDLDNERVYNHRFGAKLNRRDILDLILTTFPILHHAYELKENYRFINKTVSYEYIVSHYDEILREFQDSGIKQYEEFIGILIHWKTEIMNSYKRPYDNRKQSNAFCENVNGKLNTYLSVSRGINNFTRFRKRVLYALNPRIYYALTDKLISHRKKKDPRGPYKKIKD